MLHFADLKTLNAPRAHVLRSCSSFSFPPEISRKNELAVMAAVAVWRVVCRATTVLLKSMVPLWTAEDHDRPTNNQGPREPTSVESHPL